MKRTHTGPVAGSARAAARVRRLGTRAAAVCALVCATASAARGQHPGPPIEALDHTVWTLKDGAPPTIRVVAQGADGVLWLGTNTGLYQFDGVRFQPFEPPPSQSLPSLSVSALLPLPDGTLWIGHGPGGVSMLSRGRLVSYGARDGLPEGTVNALVRDSAGTVWVATTSGLARLRGGRWQRMGPESGFPGGMTVHLIVDRRGTLWAPAAAGVFVLPRGARRFARQAPSLAPGGEGVGIPHEAPDGSVWGASLTLGLTRLSDPAGRPVPAAPAADGLSEAWTVTVDRRANAWVMLPGGMVRVPLGSSGAGGPVGGRPRLLPAERVPVTSEPVAQPLEDREGNVWVATTTGLERFRETKLTPVPLPRPMDGPSVVPAGGGSVWIGRYIGPLLALRDGAVTEGGAPSEVTCAYRDLDGDAWFAGRSGMWHLPAGASPSSARFTPVPLPPQAGPGDVQALARSPGGDLWVSIRGGRMKGVFRRRGAAWSLVPLPAGFSNQIAMAAAADSAGRVWLGYTGSRLVLADGGATRVYTERDGLRVGMVTALLVRGPRLWIGGEFGVALLEGGRVRPVRAREPFRGITGIIQTANGDLWLNGAAGVTHMEAAEVRRVVEDPAYRARTERFDHHDGLPGHAPQVRPLPTAVQGDDGRLWFTTETGVAWIDPANVRRNRMPPPVRVLGVSAAGTRYDAAGRVSLPVRTTQLQVAYTAMSYAMPERVRFRYRLSGVDTAWVDAGTRREAYYTNLRPGTYRFQVIAANEDDVWNEAGASLALQIPPTFTQTRTFLVLIATLVGGTVWLLALWRQRQLARALRAQFEGQLAERARVARELHDTLLGDMAGVAMQLSAGARRVQTSGAADATVVDLLAGLGTQVQHTLVEARRSVTAMRTAPEPLPPLHEQLAEAARRTFDGTEIAARVEHTGSPRSLTPSTEAEVVAIVTEAMANARRHARARTVTVACAYERRALRVRVRDDGRGFDPSQAAPAGHWGLIGMRERAAAIGATLDVTSAPGAGTEVTLVLPGGDGRRWGWTRFIRPGRRAGSSGIPNSSDTRATE